VALDGDTVPAIEGKAWLRRLKRHGLLLVAAAEILLIVLSSGLHDKVSDFTLARYFQVIFGGLLVLTLFVDIFGESEQTSVPEKDG
jgi:hypothetical protein